MDNLWTKFVKIISLFCFLMLNVLKISSHHGIFYEKIFNLQWEV